MTGYTNNMYTLFAVWQGYAGGLIPANMGRIRLIEQLPKKGRLIFLTKKETKDECSKRYERNL